MSQHLVAILVAVVHSQADWPPAQFRRTGRNRDRKRAAPGGSQRKVIVDLEQVSFLASMGIRTIIMGAKAINLKGGRMVLLRPTPDVEKVLTTTGIDTLISIVHDLDAAIGVVSN